MRDKVFRVIAILLVLSFGADSIGSAAESFQGIHYGAPLTVFRPEGLIDDPSRLTLSYEHALLKETYRGENGKLIIHIQDAHTNLSGQENLARCLEEIIEKYKVSLVLVEGGNVDGTLTPLKSIASSEATKRAAKSLLLQGKLAGEEYLNLISDHPMNIFGVEDMPLYLQSVEAYRRLADKRPESIEYLQKMREAVRKLKERLYPQHLIQYERQRGQGGNENILALLDISGPTGIGLQNFPNIFKLQEFRGEEKRIDFGRVNLELASLIDEFQKKGETAALKDPLLSLSKMKNEKVSQYALFQNIFEIAKEKNISMTDYPALSLYSEYLKEFLRLDLDKLLEESTQLEDKVYISSLQTSDQRLTRSIDRYLALLDIAYRIQMNAKEFSSFKANQADFKTTAVLAFLNRKLAEFGYFNDLISYKPILGQNKESLEAFYGLVDQRDEAFVKNSAALMEKENQQVVVLITGGYHTAHLKELLKDGGYSYAVITPVVNSETNQTKYEKLLLKPLAGKTQGPSEYQNVLADRSKDRVSQAMLRGIEDDFISLVGARENDPKVIDLRKVFTARREGVLNRLAAARLATRTSASLTQPEAKTVAARLADNDSEDSFLNFLRQSYEASDRQVSEMDILSILDHPFIRRHPIQGPTEDITDLQKLHLTRSAEKLRRMQFTVEKILPFIKTSKVFSGPVGIHLRKVIASYFFNIPLDNVYRGKQNLGLTYDVLERESSEPFYRLILERIDIERVILSWRDWKASDFENFSFFRNEKFLKYLYSEKSPLVQEQENRLELYFGLNGKSRHTEQQIDEKERAASKRYSAVSESSILISVQRAVMKVRRLYESYEWRDEIRTIKLDEPYFKLGYFSKETDAVIREAFPAAIGQTITVKDVISVREKDYLKIPGAGEGAISQIKQKLARYGLKLTRIPHWAIHDQDSPNSYETEQRTSNKVDRKSHAASIKIIKGSILNHKTDALIVSAPVDLRKLGGVGRLFLDQLPSEGSDVMEVVSAKVRQTNFQMGEAFEVDLTREREPWRAWVKGGERTAIHHDLSKFPRYLIFSVNHISGGVIDASRIHFSVWRALKMAESLGVRTVTFSAFGTGKLGMNPEISSKAMLRAIKKYTEKGGTSIQEIDIVVDQDEMYKVFASELNGSRLAEAEPLMISPEDYQKHWRKREWLAGILVEGKNDIRMRIDAAFALSQSEMLTEQEVDALLKASKDENVELRKMIVVGLYKPQTPEKAKKVMFEALIGFLDDQDDEVVDMALYGLSNSGVLLAPIVPKLHEMFKKSIKSMQKSFDRGRQTYAYSHLGRLINILGDIGPAASPALDDLERLKMDLTNYTGEHRTTDIYFTNGSLETAIQNIHPGQNSQSVEHSQSYPRSGEISPSLEKYIGGSGVSDDVSESLRRWIGEDGARLAARSKKVSETLTQLDELYRGTAPNHEKSYQANKILRKLSAQDFNGLARRVFKDEIAKKKPLTKITGLKGDVYLVLLALDLQQKFNAATTQGKFSKAVLDLLQRTLEYRREKELIALGALPGELTRIMTHYHQSSTDKQIKYTLQVAVSEEHNSLSKISEEISFAPAESHQEAFQRIEALIKKFMDELRLSETFDSSIRYRIVQDYDEHATNYYYLFVQKTSGARLAEVTQPLVQEVFQKNYHELTTFVDTILVPEITRQILPVKPYTFKDLGQGVDYKEGDRIEFNTRSLSVEDISLWEDLFWQAYGQWYAKMLRDALGKQAETLRSEFEDLNHLDQKIKAKGVFFYSMGIPRLRGLKVLDVGTMDGQDAILAARADAREVVGIDNVPQTLEIAGENVKQLGWDHKVSFKNVDLLNLSHSDLANDFDIVMVASTLYLIPPKLRKGVLEGLRSKLKKGGTLYIFNGGNNDLWTPDVWKNFLEQNGFSQVIIHLGPAGYPRSLFALTAVKSDVAQAASKPSVARHRNKAVARNDGEVFGARLAKYKIESLPDLTRLLEFRTENKAQKFWIDSHLIELANYMESDDLSRLGALIEKKLPEVEPDGSNLKEIVDYILDELDIRQILHEAAEKPLRALFFKIRFLYRSFDEELEAEEMAAVLGEYVLPPVRKPNEQRDFVNYIKNGRRVPAEGARLSAPVISNPRFLGVRNQEDNAFDSFSTRSKTTARRNDNLDSRLTEKQSSPRLQTIYNAAVPQSPLLHAAEVDNDSQFLLARYFVGRDKKADSGIKVNPFQIQTRNALVRVVGDSKEAKILFFSPEKRETADEAEAFDQIALSSQTLAAARLANQELLAVSKKSVDSVEAEALAATILAKSANHQASKLFVKQFLPLLNGKKHVVLSQAIDRAKIASDPSAQIEMELMLKTIQSVRHLLGEKKELLHFEFTDFQGNIYQDLSDDTAGLQPGQYERVTIARPNELLLKNAVDKAGFMVLPEISEKAKTVIPFQAVYFSAIMVAYSDHLDDSLARVLNTLIRRESVLKLTETDFQDIKMVHTANLKRYEELSILAVPIDIQAYIKAIQLSIRYVSMSA